MVPEGARAQESAERSAEPELEPLDADLEADQGDGGADRGAADELAFQPAHGRSIPDDGSVGLVPADTLDSTLVTWIATMPW